MTTEAQKPASAFARAEAGSRRVVLLLGLGVVAFVLGSVLAGGAHARVLERVAPLENELLAFTFRMLFERLWLFTTAPLLGWLIGRFSEIDAKRYALWSVLAGEGFSVLLVAGINGFEFLVADPLSLLARLVTLFLGMLATRAAVLAGREEAAEAQREAQRIAEQRKAEYAEYLAAAEGKKPE